MAGISVTQFKGNAIMQECSNMTELGETSFTDITLEQALQKLHELESDNMALRDFMRENNSVMKKQCEALALWKQRDAEKFDQTKALITALRLENEEHQVKNIDLNEKTKEQEKRILRLEDEKGHLQRQKVLTDQKILNVLSQATAQGVTLEDKSVNLDLELGATETVFVSSAEKEREILQLETDLKDKDEILKLLKTEAVKRDGELERSREETRQCLEDMKSQQKLKETIEVENRDLNQQIIQLRQQLHQEMQKNIATTKQQMQTPNLQRKQVLANTSTLIDFSNVDDLIDRAQTVEDQKKEKEELETLKQILGEEKKSKEYFLSQRDKLQEQCGELEKELVTCKNNHLAEKEQLAQMYQQQLTEVAEKAATNQSVPIQADYSNDVSALRSQVVTLFKEVDEGQNNLSAAMMAIKHKDARINELLHMNQTLHLEYNKHFTDSEMQLTNLRSQLADQHKSQQESARMKHENQKLQLSFDKLVTDYRDLCDTFDSYKKHMDGTSAENRQSKEIAEELNRLTAQVIAADEAIALRDDQITELRNRMTTGSDEMQTLKFTVKLYEEDFTKEREARTNLKEENEKLLEEIRVLRDSNKTLTDELAMYNHKQMSDLQKRATAGYGSFTSTMTPDDGSSKLRQSMRVGNNPNPGPRPQSWENQPQNIPGAGSHLVNQRLYDASMLQQQPREEEEEDLHSLIEYTCPSCNKKYPDLDSLELHVPECMEKHS